jgi:hypothetical protein
MMIEACSQSKRSRKVRWNSPTSTRMLEPRTDHCKYDGRISERFAHSEAHTASLVTIWMPELQVEKVESKPCHLSFTSLNTNSEYLNSAMRHDQSVRDASPMGCLVISHSTWATCSHFAKTRYLITPPRQHVQYYLHPQHPYQV